MKITVQITNRQLTGEKMDNIITAITEFFTSVWTLITSLTTEEIALYSLIISVFIYFMTKRSEIKMRKHESRKEQYKYFLDMIKKIYENAKTGSTSKHKFKEQARKVMFDAGSSFAIYGSKKLYREYRFYRLITSDKTIINLDFYDNNVVLLSLGRMLKIMRREVGLNRDYNDSLKMLNFMINETYKDSLRMQFIKAEYSRIRIKHIMWMNDLLSVVWIKRLYLVVIKPIIVLPFLTVFLLVKRLIIDSIAKIIRYFKKEKNDN